MEQLRETAGLTLRAILRYVRGQGGDAAVTRVLDLAGEREPAESYDDPRRWWPYETKIRVFAAAAQVLSDEAVGLHVGRTVLGHSVGAAVRLLLRLFSGPAQLIRLIASASAKFNAAADMSMLRTARGSATVQYRLRAGYRPSRYDCDYTRGLLTQLPVLFGLPAATVRHDVCQVLGAEACVYTVSWRRRRILPVRRRDGADSGDVLAGQLELLQRTAAELLTVQQPDRALALVADRAGYAVNAQALLLVAAPTPDQQGQVHGYGLTEDETTAALAAAPVTGADTVMVDIASHTQYYGYLIARCDDPPDAERRMLGAYANLAAAKLDALSALDSAARAQRMTESLLGLARALAEARTPDEIARAVAEATAVLSRAESAAVMLLDGGVPRVAAHLGFTEQRLRALEQFVVEGTSGLTARSPGTPGQGCLYVRDNRDPFVRKALDEIGHASVAVVNIALPDHSYGLLVAAFDGAQGAAWARDAMSRLVSVADQAAAALRACELLRHAWRLNHVDPLTGLANRGAFRAALEAALSTGDGAVLYVDVDGFKSVNDTLGHAAGDELLAAIAGRLQGCTRTGDLVARLAGDEFVVLTHGALGIDGLHDLAERIRRVFATPVAVRGAVRGDGAVDARVSVAGTKFRTGEPTEAVLHRAGTAMRQAKQTAPPTLVLV